MKYNKLYEFSRWDLIGRTPEFNTIKEFVVKIKELRKTYLLAARSRRKKYGKNDAYSFLYRESAFSFGYLMRTPMDVLDQEIFNRFGKRIIEPNQINLKKE